MYHSTHCMCHDLLYFLFYSYHAEFRQPCCELWQPQSPPSKTPTIKIASWITYTAPRRLFQQSFEQHRHCCRIALIFRHWNQLEPLQKYSMADRFHRWCSIPTYLPRLYFIYRWHWWKIFTEDTIGMSADFQNVLMLHWIGQIEI